jgi:hypothetical protein
MSTSSRKEREATKDSSEAAAPHISLLGAAHLHLPARAQ